MKSEARFSAARFGRVPSSIDEQGVEEDGLVFKNTGWRGVADEGGKQSIQTMREKAETPVQTRMLPKRGPHRKLGFLVIFILLLLYID